MRVICADDHDLIRKGVHSILADSFEGLVFDEAKNGQEAVCLAIINRPDLVILDINMPVLDGFRPAMKIHDLLSDIPILFLTMHSATALISEARRVGVRGFVTKDRTGETLVAAARALLQNETFFLADPVA
jgi:DNA-binding NarL/FixJ family response regulator